MPRKDSRAARRVPDEAPSREAVPRSWLRVQIGRLGPAATGAGAFLCAAFLLTGALGATARWYPVFAASDVRLYHAYAKHMDAGYRPYVDFRAEYPSAAMRLFALPGHPAAPDEYLRWFAGLMLLALGGAAIFTSAAAGRLGRTGRAVLAIAATFACSVLALGAVTLNRYDAAVALFVALFLWSLAARRWTAAGVALGIATALKLTPVVLLPLPLILASRWRDRILAAVAFAAAAVLPFLLEGRAAWVGIRAVLRYHTARPLQVESVLATPLFLAHLAGSTRIAVAHSFGAHGVVAPGASALAAVSGPLALALCGLALGLAWRASRRGMDERSWIPLASVALMLALLCSAKVLSPQFLIWLLPAVALLTPVAPGLTSGIALAFLLTGLEFPRLYGSYIRLRPGAVALVATRNLLLVVCLAWALLRLARWRPPSGLTTTPRSPGPGAS